MEDAADAYWLHQPGEDELWDRSFAMAQQDCWPINETADALFDRGRYREAFSSYAVTYTIPDPCEIDNIVGHCDPGHSVNAGLVLASNGDFHNATLRFRAAIAADVAAKTDIYPATHLVLGLSLWAEGDHSGAKSEWREAMRRYGIPGMEDWNFGPDANRVEALRFYFIPPGSGPTP